MQKGEKMISKKILVLLALAPVTAGVVTVAAVNSASALNKVDAATMPTNTRRIWVLNNDDWWTDNNYWIYAWNDSGSYGSTATTKINMVLTDLHHGLGYADITLTNATSAFKLRVVNSWGDYGQTVTLNIPAIGGEDLVWMNSGGTWDGNEKRNDRNASLGTKGVSAAQMHYIFTNGLFNPCSTNNTNGYNSYPQMYTDFYQPTDADLTQEIVSGSYTVQNYIDTMAAMYDYYN